MAKPTFQNAGLRAPSAGGFQRYDRGYWIRRPDRASTKARTNATLYSGVQPQLDPNGSDSIGLWINEVASDFAIAGTTAQSRHRRTFFARNLVQVAFSLSGQTPNQYESGRLAEFVRRAQIRALTEQTLMRLAIPGGGIPAKRNMKGRRRPIDVIGYVENFPRVSERWVNAPGYTFDFIISRSLSGLFRDEAVRVNYIESWMDIFEDPKFQAQGIEDPDLSLRDEGADAPGGITRPPDRGTRAPQIEGGKGPLGGRPLP